MNFYEPKDASPVQCSFCERAEPDVDAMIKGPGENICDSCVGECDQLISAKSFKPDGTISCSFCSKARHIIDKKAINSDGYICNDCIDLCKEIVEEHQWRKTGYTFCSFFCRKSADQVPFIVKGQNENICSECVNLFSTILVEKPVRIEVVQNQNCAFCGISGRETYLAGIANFICEKCLNECKQQIEANRIDKKQSFSCTFSSVPCVSQNG